MKIQFFRTENFCRFCEKFSVEMKKKIIADETILTLMQIPIAILPEFPVYYKVF